MVVAVKQVEFEDRLKEFRDERIAMIREGEVPVRMEEGARIALHIVPSRAFEADMNIDLSAIKQGRDFLWPIHGGNGGSVRYNFDGLLFDSTKAEYATSYVQLFHNGIVEAVNSSLLKNRSDRLTIASLLFEEEVRKIVSASLAVLKKYDVEAPLYILLSLLRVKGYYMALSRSDYDESYPIDRSDLLLPPAVFDSFESDVDQVLLPAFNRVWNASGVVRSPNYDENDRWVGHGER